MEDVHREDSVASQNERLIQVNSGEEGQMI